MHPSHQSGSKLVVNHLNYEIIHHVFFTWYFPQSPLSSPNICTVPWTSRKKCWKLKINWEYNYVLSSWRIAMELIKLLYWGNVEKNCLSYGNNKILLKSLSGKVSEKNTKFVIKVFANLIFLKWFSFRTSFG